MAQYDIVWSAKLSASTGTIAVGTALVFSSSSDHHLAATTANRASYGRSVGVALTAGDSSNLSVQMQVSGTIPATVSGLAAGSASWVRVSTTGTLERCTPGTGDDLIGYAEADGSVHLCPGVFQPGFTSITLPLSAANGGFGADVSAQTGIPKIAGGSFSFVTAPSGTIVGTSDSQTLTNKTIAGANNTLTVRLANDVSGQLPLANGGFGADVSAQTGIPKIAAGSFSFVTAPSGTIVGTSDAQTLTNKTIAGASNTLTVRLANDVTGTLPLANGGFGADVSAQAGIPIVAAGSFSFATAPSGTIVGTSDSQTLTNKTLTSPTIATPTLSGASAVTSNNAKGTNTDVNPVNVQTTDATVTTLDSFTLASNTTVVVSWLVVATRSTMATAAAYSVTACFRNNGGTVAQVGTTTTTVIGEDVAGWDATADNSTTTIRLRVTGAGSTTIQWSAICTRFTVIP